MNSNFNPSYLQDWLFNIFAPTLLVYSTPESENIIKKNNVTPAEFIRPFANYADTTISFSVGDKFSINMKNFRLDTYDYHKFKKTSHEEMKAALEQVLIQNEPNVTKNTVPFNIKRREDFIKKINSNYNFIWYSEYERVYFESLFFNEYENYQQPFGYVFMCNINDSPEELKKLKKKEKIPLLLAEGIYEVMMPTMILVLYDKTEKILSSEEIINKVEQIRGENQKFFVFFCEINSQTENNIKQNDIWTSLIHKLDLYDPLYKLANVEKGKLISLEERENLKAAFLKFTNEYIKPYLQKTIISLDNEVSENKKGFRYNITSLFKKTEKVEYLPSLGIYKFTPIEKKIFLLSVIQFYFRDFDDAADNLKILMNDVKNKSPLHYNSLCEMYFLCMFISGKYKELDLDLPYTNYQKSKASSKQIVRYTFIHVRMLEHQRKFLEIPRIIMRINSESANIPYLHPLPFEKAAYYFIIDTTQLYQTNRKFCFYMFLAGLSYLNQTDLDLKSYCLNCYYIIMNFFKYDNYSFLKVKEHIQSQMGEISSRANKNDLASKFYINCISMSMYSLGNEEKQALLIRNFIKAIKESNYFISNDSIDTITSKYTVRDIKIPEIINSTMITYEEQDSALLKHKGWKKFIIYNKVEKEYINLSESDCIILQNLDCLAENKHFKNRKKEFKSFVGKKILVKIQIKNPFNLNLSISSIKLLTQYEENDLVNTDVELEEQSQLLEMRSTNSYTLCIIPKKQGNLIILGVEICLFKTVSFRHFFTEYDIRDENNLYKDKLDKPDNYKLIKYNIQKEETDIILKFDNNLKTLMQYEFSTIKAKITNNSNFSIKKFCIFFENSNIYIGNYIIYEKLIKKGNEFEFDIPICSQVSGKFETKILIKFEEESKHKEIEIKRYVYPITIIPSVKHEIYEKIISYDSNVKRMQLNAKLSYLVNKDEVVNKNDAQINYNIIGIDNQEAILNNFLTSISADNWERLDYKEKNIVYYYGKLKFEKENLKKINESPFDDKNHISIETLKNLFNSSEINSECLNVINNTINSKITKTTIILTFDIITSSSILKCGIFHNIIVQNPVYDRKFVLSSIRKNIDSNITWKLIEDNTNLVSIDLKISSLYNCLDLNYYEIFVKDDSDFAWIGMKRRIIRSSNSICHINFKFTTKAKGLIDANRIGMNLHFNTAMQDNNKIITFDYLPIPLIIDIQ